MRNLANVFTTSKRTKGLDTEKDLIFSMRCDDNTQDTDLTLAASDGFIKLLRDP